MASPNIKVHLVPDGYNPNLDSSESYNLHDEKTITVASPLDQRSCRLIERGVDGTLSGTTDSYGFSPRTLIKLKPISTGSKTYQIDIGAGAYHDTNKANFFTQNNWVIGNSSSWTLEDWVLNHREFAPPGGEINPRFLQFQVFIKRVSTFLGVQGSSGDSIQLNYTYIPYFGCYSFNWNESGYPPGGLNFFGDFRPIYQTYDSSKDEIVWSGELNYTIDEVNKRITFSDDFFNEENIGGYEVYIRTFIYRTGNNHSSSPAGVGSSGDLVYYAIPHDDLVQGSYGSPSFTGVSNSFNIQPDQGIIAYSRTTTSHYPPSGTTVTLDSYKYHRWIRLGNDMTDDFIFRKYTKKNTTTDFIEIFNYENTDDAVGEKGHIEDPPNQEQQEHVSFTWGDIKITNEATHSSLDPPQLIDSFVDFVPRGKTTGGQNSEQIVYGIGGLVNETRPWDHQEGSPVETYQACFARATRNYLNLYRKPVEVYGGSPPGDIYNGDPTWNGFSSEKNQALYDNPMYRMNAAQAWRIKKWYNSSDAGTSGLRFRLSTTLDNIMKDAQTTAEPTVVIEGVGHPTPGSNILYVRVVYMLFDGESNPTVKSPVATAPKTWSMRIKGDYIG